MDSQETFQFSQEIWLTLDFPALVMSREGREINDGIGPTGPQLVTPPPGT